MKGLKSIHWGCYSRVLHVGVAFALAVNLWVTARAGATPAEDKRIVVNTASRTLGLYAGDTLVRQFPVGVGRFGFPTPLGKYQIIRKVQNPGWENPYKPAGKVRIKPGRNNPLGTRWLGFKQYHGGEYGIHGTDTPSSVGKYSSHGCIRMRVKDAEALFDQVPVGTPVEVVYRLAVPQKHDKKVTLAVYPDYFRKGKPTPEQVKQQILQRFPHAKIDDGQVLKALKLQSQKPMEVGTLPEEAIVNEGSPRSPLPKPSPSQRAERLRER